LGFRVPMVVASPWSRGGKVCPELFDHTSTLQFLENFLSKKYDKSIKQDNISPWRRAICGDLTSIFDRYEQNKKDKVDFLDLDTHVEQIHNAKFKRKQNDFKPLNDEEIEAINKDPKGSGLMSHQESGVRKACPLPYQLYVDGQLTDEKKHFKLQMRAGNDVFGKKSSGSP